MDQARAAGRGLSAGAQIGRGSGAGGALRAAGISLLLARRARLLGGGTAHPARHICRRAAVSPSHFRRRNSARDRAGRRFSLRLGLCAERRRGFCRKDGFLRQMETSSAERTPAACGSSCAVTSIARAANATCTPRAQSTVVGQRPEEREIFERVLGRGLVDVDRALDPNNDDLHLVGAVAEVARARYRLAHRLHSRE